MCRGVRLCLLPPTTSANADTEGWSVLTWPMQMKLSVQILTVSSRFAILLDDGHGWMRRRAMKSNVKFGVMMLIVMTSDDDDDDV